MKYDIKLTKAPDLGETVYRANCEQCTRSFEFNSALTKYVVCPNCYNRMEFKGDETNVAPCQAGPQTVGSEN